MRSLASLLLAACAAAAAGESPYPGFASLNADPGAWPHILSSAGFHPQPASLARILIARDGTPAAPEWKERVRRGAVLILEGSSPLAQMFGFQAEAGKLRVGRLVDARRPQLEIVWEKAVEAPRFEVSGQARVFARERWSGAPVMAGFQEGAGAVLWVAVSPGERGYERFPYVLQALADLGLRPPFRSARLWAFFDYAYRTRVDLDYFAARWRASGIAALHVAAWHFHEPDAGRDAYLKRLLEACHRKGILVYAWLELPHVSERFWNDHPEWREQTALLQDAHLDWRKLMNLLNRDCFRAAAAGVKQMIQRFDWDGINLAELYFESLEGAAGPARFTPMNSDVREGFRSLRGFDPLELFGARKDPESLRAFLDYRADLARRMQEEWLRELDGIRRQRPDLELVLTHVDDRFDTRMRDLIGADAARVLPLLDRHDFTFLIEDPATLWDLGPQRYPEIARRYQPIAPRAEKLAIDINVVERYQDVYPTRQQTGTELFQLVHLASRSFPRVALYFENSILKPDLPLLPAAAAVVNRAEMVGDKLVVESPYGVGIPWTGPALVDGLPWPAADDSTLWLPAGTHAVQPGGVTPPLRLLDFNGSLKTARVLAGGGVEFTYQSSSRALAVLDRAPRRVEIDGEQAEPRSLVSRNGVTVYLPRGSHLVAVH
ncbi:MAG: hypothetical protein IT158_04975 [Bryobacterales bacterium]|nr:hypothetical protein [Bryobacterales bacterium]